MVCEIIQTANHAARAVPEGTTLPPAVQRVLNEALRLERQALARLAALGAAKPDAAPPYGNFLKAGKRRAAALTALMKAYGVVPEDREISVVGAGTEGLHHGFKEDTANRIKLYSDVLGPLEATHPEIASVLRVMRDRALRRHILALGRHAGKADTAPDLRSDPKGSVCTGHRHAHRGRGAYSTGCDSVRSHRKGH